MYAVVTPSNFFEIQEFGYLERQPASRPAQKSHRGNPPITMATAATAPTTPAFRLWSALSPTAPPVFPELELVDCVGCEGFPGLFASVGSKGNGSAVNTAVEPADSVVVGLKIENGSTENAVPVGSAAIVMSLSVYPYPEHAIANSTRKPWRRQWAERLGK